MDTIRIDILNPKAKKLLENLEALNLISIKKDSKKRFKEIVKQLRTKSTSTQNNANDRAEKRKINIYPARYTE